MNTGQYLCSGADQRHRFLHVVSADHLIQPLKHKHTHLSHI